MPNCAGTGWWPRIRSAQGGDATARWYEFDVTGGVASLKQQGNIDPGPGVHTYFPSIAINAAGDIGLTYMQSSASEYVSMYVTGQRAGDPAGAMGIPALVKAGDTTYPGGRGGDYSGITVDPVTDTFWAANEVILRSAFWSTWIGEFQRRADPGRRLVCGGRQHGRQPGAAHLHAGRRCQRSSSTTWTRPWNCTRRTDRWWRRTTTRPATRGMP